MIIGHCEVGPLGPFIYSFHMPLFFFVAGYFLKIRPIAQEIQLSLKRLVVPYAFTAFCICVAAFVTDMTHYTWADGSYTQQTAIKYLLGFKNEYAPKWIVGTIGVPWFILAMFWARLVAVFLVSKIKSVKLLCIIFFVLAVIGMGLYKFAFVPYCFSQGLVASSFIYMGCLVKNFQIFEENKIKRVFPFLLLLWFYSWSQGGVGMVSCWFSTGFVFGLFGALGAFIALFAIAKSLYNKESLFWRTLHFWGRYSLVIYCVHSVEYSASNWKAFALLHHIPLEHFGLFQISARMAIAFGFSLLLLKIRPLREQIFQIKMT